MHEAAMQGYACGAGRCTALKRGRRAEKGVQARWIGTAGSVDGRGADLCRERGAAQLPHRFDLARQVDTEKADQQGAQG
ncbi:hypothetical protein D3C77_538790 [compost metagenome]